MLATAREVARLESRCGQNPQPLRGEKYTAGRASGRRRSHPDAARSVRTRRRRFSRTVTA